MALHFRRDQPDLCHRAFAIAIILLVVGYGFTSTASTGSNVFVPSGVTPVPAAPHRPDRDHLLPSRPVSLSVRLFANMLAGHIMLAVFGGFVVMLLGAGAYALLAPLPLLGIVLLTALRTAGRRAAGLCLRHSHLRLSERRNSPGPLINLSQQQMVAHKSKWRCINGF